jgi:hypothetical protein
VLEQKPTIEITSATIAKQKINEKIKNLVLNTSQVDEEESMLESMLDQSMIQTSLPTISSQGRQMQQQGSQLSD